MESRGRQGKAKIKDHCEKCKTILLVFPVRSAQKGHKLGDRAHDIIIHKSLPVISNEMHIIHTTPRVQFPNRYIQTNSAIKL